MKQETIGIIFEMTRPLPTKIGPIEGGMRHARSSVRYFVFFDIHGRYFLIGRCTHGQPNNIKELLAVPVLNHTQVKKGEMNEYDVSRV